MPPDILDIYASNVEGLFKDEILAVPGLTEALAETAASTVAISPIVGREAVSGPAGQLMAASGLPVSAAGIARLYARWLDILVFDEQDRQQLPEILELGVSPVTAQTIMANREDEAALACRVLELLR